MGMIDREETLKAMDTWDKFGYLANHGLIRLGKENKYYVQYVRYEDMVKAVNSMPTVEAIPKADYETRLKADLVAILTDFLMDIEENTSINSDDSHERNGKRLMRTEIIGMFEQKINSLKEK